MKDKIYQVLPHFLQNLLISIYNYSSKRGRLGKKYKYYRQLFRNNRSLSLNDLKEIQYSKYTSLINYAVTNSSYYNSKLRTISGYNNLENIQNIPILSKENIRKNIKDIHTIPKSSGMVSKTGGTTGKSLEVLFTKDNFQERFAMLDNFRSDFGYELGKKTAWFSGKNILTSRDVKRKRFWKKDYFNNLKYYSTFHIKNDYLEYYIKDLIKFKPEYLVGFPSNIVEIAKYGSLNNIVFPKGVVKAIFPTAESITSDSREIVESYFHCSLYDQYASSEGAPFIIECVNKKLHMELQSGIFEVLNANNESVKKGRLVVTSFTTYGTPLIRYDIGDSIELSDDTCDCGNNNPIVKQILGRIDDYIYSPERGKINLGNVSNTLKDTSGIVKFQVEQNSINHLHIKLIIDSKYYDDKSRTKFEKNWRDRVGDAMVIDYEYVTEIDLESSGKFRLVKNNIKNLIESKF